MSACSLAMILGFLGFGMFEMLVIAMVALLIFGGELPDAMRSLGRAYGKFRRALDEVSKPVREEIRRTTDLPSPRQTARELDAEVRRAGTTKAAKTATSPDPDPEDAPSTTTDTEPSGGEDEAAPWPDDAPPNV